MLQLTRNERNFEEEVLKTFFGNHLYDEVFYSPKGVMKTDVEETDDEVTLTINLPGFKKEDLDINFEEGYLTVKAEVKEKENKKENKKYVLKERVNGLVSRTYYLGERIDTEAIKATLNDGVLEIVCKKAVKPTKNIVIE